MALAANMPTTWDSLLSTTMNNYRKTLTDNIFGGRVLLDYLQSKGRVRMLDGGYQIVEPLLIGPGDANSYGPWEQIQANYVDGITSAVYPWRQLYATILISGLEEAQNNGKEQIINLLEAKIMQAEETLKSILSQMLWGTRGANAKSTDFTPLTTLVDATAAAGGITPAAAPAPENVWRSPTLNATTGAGTDAKGNAFTLDAVTDGASLEAALRRMYMLASDGGSDHVDAIFAGSDLFEAYEGSLTPQVRYTDTSKANLGFQNLMFKNVALFWDPDAPTNGALGLNSKYVGLTLHSDRNFVQSPFSANMTGLSSSRANTATSTPTTSPGFTTPVAAAANTLDARVSYITTYGNTTTRERRRNFKITNFTPF